MVDQTHRAATMKTANQALNRYADEPDEPPVQTVPMMIDGGLLRGQVFVVIGQVIGALGVLIGFMGYAEQSWIVKLYRFTQVEAAAPVLGLLATGITTIILMIRNRRKKIQRTVLAALAPDSVAQVTGKISAPIQLAIDDAIVAQHAVEVQASQQAMAPVSNPLHPNPRPDYVQRGM